MKHRDTIQGHHAPPPRPTWQAALLLACVLSVPFVATAAIELLFF